MNILLSILATMLIFVDVIALRKSEKKNKELTKENKRLKMLLER